MSITAKQLVTYFQRAVAENWGYVWSLNGEIYTRALAEQYHKIKRNTSSHRDPSTYWLTDCAKWIGRMAADCSGGIVGAFRSFDPSYQDQGANTFYSRCTEKGAISTIPEIAGLCVWRDGHIGIYEGNGYALEFRGTDYGAVRTKLSERNFTHWGRLRDVIYGEDKKTMPIIITLQSPLMRGDEVQALQAALNALGYPCGETDGIAGKNTMAAIAAFCAAHGAVKTVEVEKVVEKVVEVPAALPDVLTLAVEFGGKRYTLEAKAV